MTPNFPHLPLQCTCSEPFLTWMASAGQMQAHVCAHTCPCTHAQTHKAQAHTWSGGRCAWLRASRRCTAVRCASRPVLLRLPGSYLRLRHRGGLCLSLRQVVGLCYGVQHALGLVCNPVSHTHSFVCARGAVIKLHMLVLLTLLATTRTARKPARGKSWVLRVRDVSRRRMCLQSSAWLHSTGRKEGARQIDAERERERESSWLHIPHAEMHSVLSADAYSEPPPVKRNVPRRGCCALFCPGGICSATRCLSAVGGGRIRTDDGNPSSLLSLERQGFLQGSIPTEREIHLCKHVCLDDVLVTNS